MEGGGGLRWMSGRSGMGENIEWIKRKKVRWKGGGGQEGGWSLLVWAARRAGEWMGGWVGGVVS